MMLRVTFLGLVALLAFGGWVLAADRAGTLPEGMFATGEGCAALEKALPEDLDMKEFAVLSNTDLVTYGLSCHFRDATALKKEDKRAWSVRAECNTHGTVEPAEVSIEEADEDQFEVFVIWEGEPDYMGRFIVCPNVLAE